MESVQPEPKPRPRQFVGEVGIIVVGVLLALSAQEVVQEFHWRSELAEARTSLNVQLAESYFASEERIKDSDCISRKLDRLDAAIAGDRPQITTIELGGLRPWFTSSWDAAVASGTVAHMPPEERIRYADLFAFTAAMREMHQKEFEISNGLETLVHHDRMTDVSRDRLAQDIAHSQGINRMLTLGARQWLEGAKGLGLTLSADNRKALAKPDACIMPDAPAATPT